jgi:class 3 adenylate cyclase
VTVLFMNRFFQILSEGVVRFGGTVDKFTGDGIMALFGAPVSQEDHARRACLAALHLTETITAYAAQLRESKSLDLHARLGLNSGEVVLGGIGDEGRMDYTALGHTVGLAQRMEALAEPDMECFALLTRARILAATGSDNDDVEADLLAALALARETGATTYEAEIEAGWPSVFPRYGEREEQEPD